MIFRHASPYAEPKAQSLDRSRPLGRIGVCAIPSVPVFAIMELRFTRSDSRVVNIAEDHSSRKGIIFQDDGRHSFLLPVNGHILVENVHFGNQHQWKPLEGRNRLKPSTLLTGTLSFRPDGYVLYDDMWICQPSIWGIPQGTPRAPEMPAPCNNGNGWMPEKLRRLLPGKC